MLYRRRAPRAARALAAALIVLPIMALSWALLFTVTALMLSLAEGLR